MGGGTLGRADPVAAEPTGDGVVGPRGDPGRACRGQPARARDVDLRRSIVTLTSKDVVEITRLLEESAFTELHLEVDGLKISLKRGAGAAVGAATTPAEPPIAAARSGTPPKAPGAATQPADQHRHTVAAPLLGTFYRAPKPGAAPFVEVGSAVNEDTIVGIIEVMTLMNAVRAGASGTVLEILGRDGALVEYGEALLRIERAS